MIESLNYTVLILLFLYKKALTVICRIYIGFLSENCLNDHVFKYLPTVQTIVRTIYFITKLK